MNGNRPTPVRLWRLIRTLAHWQARMHRRLVVLPVIRMIKNQKGQDND